MYVYMNVYIQTVLCVHIIHTSSALPFTSLELIISPKHSTSFDLSSEDLLDAVLPEMKQFINMLKFDFEISEDDLPIKGSDRLLFRTEAISKG